ncbi:WRB/Get1 family [Catenaria anguillulae PL171]|uniref:WRB/Get1 family n=1 Tax=Catenaria anguillulae PL171 TaxID=765915 RepID=A0A1Y2HQG7_9FUNG|nr:WRB/Get1 family [Catenaria anguillulae PL171]
MPPALTVLVGAIFIELVSWLGFTLISEQLFAVYRWVFYRSSYAQQAQLRDEIFGLRKEVKGVSAMDEFAKWARVRRQLDGKTQAYEEITNTLRSTRTMFLLKAQVFTRGLFYLVYLGLSIAYRTTPMFYASDDWFGGGLIGWFLSLPFAPAGAISVVVWVYACRRVLRNVMELVLGDKLDAVPEQAADGVLAEKDKTD